MASLTWAVILLAGLTCINALGNQIKIDDFNSIAQVEFHIATIWRQQCSCNIITNFHCVTTATCVRDILSNRRIRAGSALRGAGGMLQEVNRITIHPDFEAGSNDADIGIIRLAASLWFGQHINRIAIMPQDFFLPANLNVEFAGYGVTAEGGIVGNNNLYSLTLHTKALATCQEQFPGRVTNNMICVGLAGSTGRDFDLSDAGSPIHYSNILAGITSFGHSRGNDELPIVATAVAYYTNWIIANAV